MAISFNIPTENAQRTVDEVVGRFRSGYQTSSGRPVSLDAFRVTTGDKEVAETIGAVLGMDDTGVSTWDTSTDEVMQVFTSATEVPIIVEPRSIKTSLVLWSNKGAKIVETDGQFLIEDGKVTDKPWAGAGKPLAEMKADAQAGVGPAPSLQCYFRIAEYEDLGKFKFFSGSWGAIESFSAAELAVEKIGGAARATLGLERVEFTNRDGQNVSFVKPYLKVHGAVEA
jgi:hypothetical protein